MSRINRALEDQKQLVSAFPRARALADTRTSNGRLIAALGWTTDRYWKAHRALVGQGLIIVGRGRGGSAQLSTRANVALRAIEA